MKTIITIFFLIISISLQSQIIVYRTFEDFQDDKGEMYDSYLRNTQALGKIILIFKKGRKKIRIRCRDIWGFTYDDAFFRIDTKQDLPTRVLSIGKIVYYENGFAHLGILKHNIHTGWYGKGYAGYFSEDINSEMVPVPSQPMSAAKRAIRKFKEKHPEYSELFECLGKDFSQENLHPCLEKFEGFGESSE